MQSSGSNVIVKKEGAIGWLIFNDPARHNAISMHMAEAVPDAIAELERDDAIRVIVVTGAGDRSFIAGSNISSFGEVRSNPDQNRHYHLTNERAYDAVYLCEKPTIAMIQGYCIGGGLDFAASCDIRICSNQASFSIPAGRLGVGYGYEGQMRLNRIISPAQARDIFFTARRYSAEEAVRMGLAHEVVPHADLEARIREYAASVAANAPLTLKAIKRGFIELERAATRTDMSAAQALINVCFDSEDYREGRQAFAEKRTPSFKGR